MKKRYVVAGILAAAGLICGGIAYYQYYQDAHAGQEYEKIKENIDRNNRVSKTQKNDVNKEKIEFERPKREIKSSDKTRNEKARKKTPQEIREEMLRKLDESKLK